MDKTKKSKDGSSDLNSLKQAKCIATLNKYKFIMVIANPIPSFVLFASILISIFLISILFSVDKLLVLSFELIIIIYLLFFGVYGMYCGVFPIKDLPIEKSFFKKTSSLLIRLTTNKTILRKIDTKRLLVKLFESQYAAIDNFLYKDDYMPEAYNASMKEASLAWENIKISLIWLVSVGDEETILKTVKEGTDLYNKINYFDFKNEDPLIYEKEILKSNEILGSIVTAYVKSNNKKMPNYKMHDNEGIQAKLRKFFEKNKRIFCILLGLFVIGFVAYVYFAPTPLLRPDPIVVIFILVIAFLLILGKTDTIIDFLKNWGKR
ncbi:MAG: hypothetical protein WC462_02635 [archaeon]